MKTVGIIFVLALLCVSAAFGLIYTGVIDKPDLGQDDEQGTDDASDGSQTGPWIDEKPKKVLSLNPESGGQVGSAEVFIFSEQSRDPGDRLASITTGDSTVVFQDNPGKYYYRVESQGFYSTTGSFTIPDGSSYNKSIDQYNEEPETVSIDLNRRHEVTVSNMALGVNSHTTSVKEWSSSVTIRPVPSEEYRPSSIILRTGSADPTTFSYSDGRIVYDEGVEKVVVEVSGAVEGSKVLFDPEEGVDRFGSDNRARVQISELTGKDGVVVERDEPLQLLFRVVTSDTSTCCASDGDGVLSVGENLFDFKFRDEAGISSNWIELTA